MRQTVRDRFGSAHLEVDSSILSGSDHYFFSLSEKRPYLTQTTVLLADWLQACFLLLRAALHTGSHGLGASPSVRLDMPFASPGRSRNPDFEQPQLPHSASWGHFFWTTNASKIPTACVCIKTEVSKWANRGHREATGGKSWNFVPIRCEPAGDGKLACLGAFSTCLYAPSKFRKIPAINESRESV